jgi:thiol peroxidase
VAKIQYENASYRIYGDLPTIGSHAPDISLVNASLQNVSFASFMGVRKVLNIFISVDTSVCAKSVIEFDRLAGEADDVAMLMVSYEHGLEHVIGLSAIRHDGFGENYGVRIIEGPYAGMFARAVVVLDENNTVVHREQTEDISKEPDYRAAFRALGIEIDE